MKKRHVRAFLSLAGIIFLTFIIHSYKKENEQEIPFPKSLYGIPTYENSRLSSRMSSPTGNPYIAVFLSQDSHDRIVQFYKDQLKMDYKVLEYGQRSVVTMRVYQFEIEKGVLKNYINKGVEVIPLNSRSQMVHNARTKIKIVLPRKEVLEFNQKQKKGNTSGKTSR
ncbi:MAG: hypothetical protein GY940_31275 [bacterium]|nr:hypothetical protein [bacterium]